VYAFGDVSFRFTIEYMLYVDMWSLLQFDFLEEVVAARDKQLP